jgi:hypothetical protein
MALEPLAPGMVGRPRLGVRPQEMVQDVQQGKHMRPVAAQLGSPNIIDDHVSNRLASAFLREEVCGQRRGSNSRKVFVFGNGEYLLFGQTAQRDAIFKCDHVLGRSPWLAMIRG